MLSIPLSFSPVLVLIVSLWTFSSLAYPNCNPALYGTPVENDCHDIFFDRPWTGNKGLASLDSYTHYWGAVGNPSSRPADVARRHWARRVDLPRTWHDGECSALLSPNLDSTGRPKYDTGKYAVIADAATYIESACGHSDEMSLTTGLMSGGSIDGAGDHYRLTMILYHPRSRFAEAIRADVAAKRIMDYGAINFAGPADTYTNPFIDPNTQGSRNSNQPDSSSSSTNRASAAPAQCGRNPYCSRASDCSREGCKCVADGAINYWSSSCKVFDSSAVISGAGRGLLENNGTSGASSPGTSSNDTAVTDQEVIAGDLSDLACPCNCTYVSKQCCASDSGIVYEDPAKHLGSLRAPTEALECDRMTGAWKEKSGTR